MLSSLSITNFALIDELEIQLSPGLNIFTGETGAGKSIIMDAFAAVLGERLSAKEFIRTGESTARVEAQFEVGDNPRLKELLEAAEIPWEADHTLVVVRELHQSGKSRCLINGAMAPLALLKDAGATLVDLHGQHEHQQLLDSEHQRRIVDAYGGKKLHEVRHRVEIHVKELHAVERELAELVRLESTRSAERELSTFQLEEIEAAAIDLEADTGLEVKLKMLAHQERLGREAREIHDLLRGEGDEMPSVLARLSLARHRIEELAEIDPGLKALLERLDEAYFGLEELGSELGNRYSSMEFDAEELSRIEQRIGILTRLKRKYGPGLAEVVARRDELARRLKEASDLGHKILDLGNRKVELLRLLTIAAPDLSKRRKEAASQLAKRVKDHLKDLALPHAQVEILVQVVLDPGSELVIGGEPCRLGAHGIDRVEFRISLNPGEPPKPLARVASGGEISRIMLAIKSSQATLDRVPIMVFDEIDTGIGGTTAVKVAKKLHQVSRECQTLVITHLPQIASLGDAQYAVEKSVRHGRTFVTVERLSADQRVREIQRMLGGEEQASLQHAREMLGSAG